MHSRIFWYVLLFRLSQALCETCASAALAATKADSATAAMTTARTRPRVIAPAIPLMFSPLLGPKWCVRMEVPFRPQTLDDSAFAESLKVPCGTGV
jgi:hypothetical protein